MEKQKQIAQQATLDNFLIKLNFKNLYVCVYIYICI